MRLDAEPRHEGRGGEEAREARELGARPRERRGITSQLALRASRLAGALRDEAARDGLAGTGPHVDLDERQLLAPAQQARLDQDVLVDGGRQVGDGEIDDGVLEAGPTSPAATSITDAATPPCSAPPGLELPSWNGTRSSARAASAVSMRTPSPST
jgi:hypothetical protein